jgi:hypothetical protein
MGEGRVRVGPAARPEKKKKKKKKKHMGGTPMRLTGKMPVLRKTPTRWCE